MAWLNECQSEEYDQDVDEFAYRKLDERSENVKFIHKWLEVNYEYKSGACLPRCILYAHYLDLCKRKAQMIVGAATFGKIIRQKFPALKTRRLGTRGQSKYHYFGLAIKISSIYNVRKHFGKGLTRFTASTRPDQHSRNKKFHSQKVVPFLSGFPKIWVSPGANLTKNLVKVQLFLVMYKAHCQRMLDAIVAGNFGEVETFLLHFWHRMPDHMSKNLNIDAVSEVVTACDIIFYKKLIDVLLPDTIRDIHKSFEDDVVSFTKNFLPWLDICLINAPKKLADSKMEVARMYIRIIERHLSFLKLAKDVCTMLTDDDTKNSIMKDFEETNFEAVFGIFRSQQLDSNTEETSFYIYLRNMTQYLGKQISVEALTSLLDKILYDWVIKPVEASERNLKQHSTEFVLQWSHMVDMFMKDLTLRNAPSFNSIHLLTVMVMDYILLVVQLRLAAEQEGQVWQKVKQYAVVDQANSSALAVMNGKCKIPDGRRKRKPDTALHSSNNKLFPQNYYPINFPPSNFNGENSTSEWLYNNQGQFYMQNFPTNTCDTSNNFNGKNFDTLTNYANNYITNTFNSYLLNDTNESIPGSFSSLLYDSHADATTYGNFAGRTENASIGVPDAAILSSLNDIIQEDYSQFYHYLKDISNNSEAMDFLGY